MLSVKSTTAKKTKTLYCLFLTISLFLLGSFITVSAQDNSPYSRFGIGDLVPHSNITSRAMGGLTAGFSEIYSINFNNPASYYNFQAVQQGKDKKLSYGRVIFDVGMNFENRRLEQISPAAKFNASNALFSYAQIGLPLKRNWGLAFGIRPISRISYKIVRNERLYDPNTGSNIDSAQTRFEGDGGSYLANLGTGFSVISKNDGKKIEYLSFGINGGYYFGKKDYASKRSLINDSVQYFQGNYQTKTSFGNIYFSAGMQYRKSLDDKGLLLTAGLYGSWGQHLNASQDRIRETFVYDPSVGDVRLDSVSDIKDIKGKIVLPSNYTAGVVIQKPPTREKAGWLLGIDFNSQSWSKYRFYGQADSVRNKWELRVGAQVNPVLGKSFFSNVAYRAGLFIGPDYIDVQNKLPQFGLSVGMGLPILGKNMFNYNQVSILNLSFEYIRRGNSSNILRENLFRLSAGFSLTDIWFGKRKYD
jgi:hypothetical protein